MRQGDSWKLSRESSSLYLLSVFSNSGASRNSLSRHNQITALKKNCSVNPWLIAVALRPKGGQPVPPTTRLEWLHPHLLPNHRQLPPAHPCSVSPLPPPMQPEPWSLLRRKGESIVFLLPPLNILMQCSTHPSPHLAPCFFLCL
jgi:hypothetical protein